MNIGDKVIVTGPEGWEGDRQEIYIDNNCYVITEAMFDYKDKEFEIVQNYRGLPDCWKLKDLPNFYWHESWLQPVETIQLSDEIFDILEE